MLRKLVKKFQRPKTNPLNTYLVSLFTELENQFPTDDLDVSHNIAWIDNKLILVVIAAEDKHYPIELEEDDFDAISDNVSEFVTDLTEMVSKQLLIDNFGESLGEVGLVTTPSDTSTDDYVDTEQLIDEMVEASLSDSFNNQNNSTDNNDSSTKNKTDSTTDGSGNDTSTSSSYSNTTKHSSSDHSPTHLGSSSPNNAYWTHNEGVSGSSISSSNSSWDSSSDSWSSGSDSGGSSSSFSSVD